MPLSTQTKLLRVLEEREFRRVGGEEVLRVDVRVIAATNRDLREQVEVGAFRRDLYHRLNVLRITLPALRERQSDIPRLIDRFVREFSRQYDRAFPGIDPAALQILVNYSWPGNVRELRNLIESMVVLAHGKPIRPEDIPVEVRDDRQRRSYLPVLARPGDRPAELPVIANPPELEFILRTIFDLKLDVEDLRREMENFRFREQREFEVPYPPPFATLAPSAVVAGPPDELAEREPDGIVIFRPGMTMQDLEREAIRAALRQVDGNRRRAAEMLGIGERTLYRKIKEYDLEG
jgi:DNA-binding NtrC family response regulator